MWRRVNDIWDKIRHWGPVAFVLTVFERFGRDNGALLSAGLAFFMVLAFVPMLLTGIAALGFYFHLTHSTHNAIDDIRNLLTSQVLPGAAGREVQHLMDRVDVIGKVKQITANRGISGIVGICGLMWASIQIYLSGAVAMNAAWQVPETRNWLKLRLVAFGLFIVTGIFLVLSIVSTAYGTILAHSGLAHYVPGWGILVEVLTEILAVVGSSVMFAVTYRYLPSAAVSWRAAFVGGVTAAVLWEVAKKGLAVYLLHPNVSMYGNLANLIIFILWVYYSMTIFVMGAEVSAVYSVEIEARHRTRLKRTASLEAARPAGSSEKGDGTATGRSRRRKAPIV